MSTKAVANHPVVITRILDAPPEKVFRMWADPQHLVKWYAPQGCTIEFHNLDIRPGGAFHSCVRIPDGHECWCVGRYLEVHEPKRISFTMAVADRDGNAITAIEAGMDPQWPDETTVTVTFEDLGGKTRLTLQQTVDESLARRTGAHPSWLNMLDQLDELLK